MTTPVPETGSLAETPLPRLLLDLYAARFTGTLELRRGRTRKTFEMHDGCPIESDSDLAAERLSQVLEDCGQLSKTDRARAERSARQGGKAEAAALLELGSISAKQVFDGLREQTRRRVIDCFGWRDGNFQVSPCSEPRADVNLFRTDPFDLVQQGLQKHWTLDDLLQSLATRMNQYASSSPRLGKVVRRLTLDATVERMIAGLSGAQTLGQLIGTSAGNPAVLSAFWVLDAADALGFSDTPSARDCEELPPEIEIEVLEADVQDRPKAAASGARDHSESTPDVSPEAEKMRVEVLERLEHVDELNFYELLGVERDAPHAAIRKAYFLAAKRYHPDAIARLGLSDVRNEAGEVFSKIAEANETLADPKRRENYNNRLDGGLPDVDIQVLAQAETFYRKGEILINMGDFRGALDYLKNAVKLYPHECVYQSDLGWAYFKKNPPEPELALQHLERALELDSDDATAQSRYDVVARS